MKNLKSRPIKLIGVLFIPLLLFPLVAFCQPAVPGNPYLESYSFEGSPWTSDDGYMPIYSTNLVFSSVWGGALQIDTTNETPVSYLAYNIVETNGLTNLSFHGGGVLIAFICDWATDDSIQLGSGPGDIGYLLAAGDFSNGSPDGLWGIFFDPHGSNIYFGGVSNSAPTIYVSAPISWPANSMHLIGLAYNGTGTAIYLDGQLAATGGPMTIVPATNVWGNGFSVGSDPSGYEQARGNFWDLVTYNSNLFGYNNYGSFLTNEWAYYSNSYAAWQGSSGGSDSFSRVYDPMGGGCPTGGPVYIANVFAALQTNGMTSVSFEIEGGTNGVLYDIFSTTNLENSLSNQQWAWIGQGLTCNTYTFTNQPAGQAFYELEVPALTMVVAWGDDDSGESDVPAGLTNATAIAAGDDFSIALRDDGTVIGWGNNYYGETNIPAGLSNVIDIAAGVYHGVAVLANGSVTNWGYYWDGTTYYCSVTNRTYASAPPTSGVVAVAAGQGQDLALMSDGTCVAWGFTNVFGTGAAYGTHVPTNLNLTNVTAIACGWQFNLALSSNGTITAWGLSDPLFGYPTNVPGDLISNVAAIAAGGNNGMALRKDGTVEAWGDPYSGVTNVPFGLSNVVAVATGGQAGLALRADGTVAAWGDPSLTNIPEGLSAVKAIAGGFVHNMALRSGQYNPVIFEEPIGQFALTSGSATFSVDVGGFPPITYQWQFDGTNIIGATNSTFTLMNAQSTNQGEYQAVVSSPSGSITSLPETFTLVLPPQITSTSPPAPSTNWINGGLVSSLSVTATAADQSEFPLTYQWSLNGTNLSGASSSTFAFFPSINPDTEGNYTVTVSNVAGTTTTSWNEIFALPGMVETWGDDASDECDRPITLTNASAIAAGEYQSVAVTDNGIVLQWGQYSDGTNYYSVTNTSVATLPPSSNIVAVAASRGHVIGLKTDGTLTNWGLTNDTANFVPANLSSVTAIAAGLRHCVALSNGFVIAWGDNSFAQTNVPPGLSNVVALAAGGNHSLAVASNGMVYTWGDTNYGLTNIPSNATNVVAVAAGSNFSLALKSDGTVVSWGSNDFGQTNAPSGMSNVMAIAAGDSHCLALINNGTLVSWGDNSNGQTNLITEGPSVEVKLIAAGGNHSMAAIFSPLVQYPIDVSKDLLLTDKSVG